FLISNTNELHFEYCLKNYPILHTMEGHILSYKERSQKPDPKFYQVAIKASGVRPEEIFYTDDREEFVEAGKALGLRATTFIDAATLRRDLASAGVLHAQP
ncbi:MAG: HAD-IA family hydrolase, partial [Terriglobia bacterium]